MRIVIGGFLLERNQDEQYMAYALKLAERGLGWTNPNPMVGAVIVAAGEVIGVGYHPRVGEGHAERQALADTVAKGHREQLAGATMYVTLEPCCHQGRTPPCTQAIIEAGIARVVVGALDSNVLVAGKGIKQLKEAGLTVDTGVLAKESRQLNRTFFHFNETGLPFVVMKYAMTLDGKIAAHTGHSQWVTGSVARQHVHRSRHAFQAIMVGVGTVIADDPLLNVRLEELSEPCHPIRVVCDSHLRTPLESRLVQSAKELPLIIATTVTDQAQQATYEAYGCQILTLPADDAGQVDLRSLMKELTKQGIISVYLEGGAQLNWSALKAGLVQEVHTYIAPKLVGGQDAPSAISGLGFGRMDEALGLRIRQIERLGEDIWIESEVTGCLQES